MVDKHCAPLKVEFFEFKYFDMERCTVFVYYWSFPDWDSNCHELSDYSFHSWPNNWPLSQNYKRHTGTESMVKLPERQRLTHYFKVK